MGKWERDPHDWYVEPEWCSQRLFEAENFGDGTILDPACGEGRILREAQRAGLSVIGNDLVDRKPCLPVTFGDFMNVMWVGPWSFTHIVSNPPFGLCDERRHNPTFVQWCLARANGKVALLMPATWHQADKRSRWLEGSGLRRIYFLTPRPSMPPGSWVAAGNKPGNGTTDFAWYVWLRGYDGPVETRWLRRDP